MSCIRQSASLSPWKHRGSYFHALGLALAATASLTFATAIATAQVPLNKVVELAQHNSSAVKLADADQRRAFALLDQAKDAYIPNLVLGSSIGPPSIGFSFSQPSIGSASMQSLFYSIQQRRYVEAANVSIQAAAFGLKEAREQVALDASNDYIELDTVSRELAAGQEQSDFAARLIEIEDQRQQAGIDSTSDLLQARLMSAQLRLKLMHLRSRAASLIGQIVALTGLDAAAVKTDHASIPEIPEVKANQPALNTAGIEAAQAGASARRIQARGDEVATKIRPLIAFGAQYNRDATSLNNYNTYFSAKKKFKADNFSAGFNITIPIFDLEKRAKSRESAAEALRATVEAEQTQRQNDVQIATLAGSLQELDALAEVASLKQQIAVEQLRAVQTSLQSGNGSGTEPGAPPQSSPKAEQLARIDERQKAIESMDASFDLARARLGLLRALGHMDDWLNEFKFEEPPQVHQREPATAPN